MQLTVLYSRRSRYAPLCFNYNHYLGFRKPSPRQAIIRPRERGAPSPALDAR
jgi:hypothetical protein